MLTKPSLRQPTPEPWNIVPDLSHMGSLTTIEAEPVPFSNKWPRMIVQVGGTASVFELEASARLIACAPETLAALRQSADWLRVALCCEAWSWDFDQRQAAEADLTTFDAIIAKATSNGI